jgi:hypothetical protein
MRRRTAEAAIGTSALPSVGAVGVIAAARHALLETIWLVSARARIGTRSPGNSTQLPSRSRPCCPRLLTDGETRARRPTFSCGMSSMTPRRASGL